MQVHALPRAAVASDITTAAAPTLLQPQPRFFRPQVLYVEDDATQRTLMQALFRLRPHLELVLAADGAEATALAPQLHPSLLLLDIRLPDCLGSELLPLLRLRFGWHDAAAVAVTSEPGWAVGRGPFDEVWRKPLDIPLVLMCLDAWLPDGLTANAAHGGAFRQRVTRPLA